MFDRDGYSQRSHDALYATSDPCSPPKESFVRVADLMQGSNLNGLKDRRPSVVDIGAAAGAFVNYLSGRLKHWDVHGVELRPDLVRSAKDFFGIQLLQGSVLDGNLLDDASIDVITLLGVVGIFDDLCEIADNVSRWVKPGGLVLLHGLFNPFDIDVFIRYRESHREGPGDLETGWNIFSQRTVRDCFIHCGASSVEFFPFTMSGDLPRTPHDPLRSWTEELANGDRQIVNGLWLKQPQYVVKISY